MVIRQELFNKYKKEVVTLFAFLTLSILLISDRETTVGISAVNYKSINTILPILFLTLGLFFVLRENVRIDTITTLLIFRLVFATITILLNTDNLYNAVRSVSILYVALFSYLYFFNRSKFISNKLFTSLIAFYLFILSCQIIIVSFIAFTQFSILEKNFIILPIGKSNYIATHLLVTVIFLFIVKNKTLFHKVTLLLGLVSLVLTFSFGALTALVSIILFYYLFFYSGSKVGKWSIIVLAFSLLYYAVFDFILKSDTFGDTLITPILDYLFSKIRYLQDSNYARASSDRIYVFTKSWELFVQNPLFGSFHGITFRDSTNMKAHNLFLEALSSYGILGFITIVLPFIFIFYKLFTSIKTHANNSLTKASFLALLAGVIHGLVEPNFFSLQFEFIWWAIAGYAVSRRSLKLE